MKEYDIIIVGGGHAGYEAAFASAKMGCKTLLISMDVLKIGALSCNPAIGGTAKGHIVKEIDALGGEMGKITDETGIQFRMLNRSRGPAVWSPRAQVDRDLYPKTTFINLLATNNLEIVQSKITGVSIENYKTNGVITDSGEYIKGKSVILTCGTFLNGLVHIGQETIKAGRLGEPSAVGLTECLQKMGFESKRLKTGTPPRIHKDSINYSLCQPQFGDEKPEPFSWRTQKILNVQIPCFLTHTNSKTHEILKSGFNRSPLFNGTIKGVGPRYCPSIETKIDRFADKDRHQIFLEPDGYESAEYYVNGFSTSLPKDIQEKALRTIPGLENAEIIRYGYAIEYDYFPPYQIKLNLESKLIEGLFFAGQINGTSGYEEAGAQGLMAGINAALKIRKTEPLILRRHEAYIGVLIDDLVNKSTEEPYRIFTSLAEYRLILRQDNADLRLTEIGRKIGLVKDDQYEVYCNKVEKISTVKKWIHQKTVKPMEINTFLRGINSSELIESEKLEKMLVRPEVSIENLIKTNSFLFPSEIIELLSFREVIREIDTTIRYKGYLKRQQELVEKFIRVEDKKIPRSIDYYLIPSLSSEAKEKLSKIKPENLGQAGRISGITPADITILLIYVEKFNRSK
jgi:tRNA uridine 5-carboxymethylaminomethyl modification enzyme